MENPFRASPSRTYVIPIFNNDFTGISFKRFTLPYNEENTCDHATWYFYNRLDSFSVGKYAYPIEMHYSIDEISEKDVGVKTKAEIYSEDQIISAIGKFNFEQKGVLNTSMIQALAKRIIDLRNENN